MNKLVKVVDLLTIYREFLEAYNWHYKLSKRELDILEKLISFDVNYDSTKEDVKNVISTKNRRSITRTLGITSENLSRYVTKLKNKGLIKNGKVEDEWYVNKDIMPTIIGDRIQLTIILKLKKDDTANKK